MEPTRTSRKTVTFKRPFTLSALSTTQPAGAYTVETDEVLLPTFTAAAYHRTATLMFLPAHPGSGGLAHMVEVDPLELESALAKDAAEQS
jgi:hypothetical protein